MSQQNRPGQLIDLDGNKVHYEKFGSGPDVLLLLPGGIGTSQTDFSEQLGEKYGLSRSLFTIIAWDPPGYGFSRPPDRVYDQDVYQRDAHLAAKLMAKLGYKSYSVLGWSDGAKTGLLMAINYQSRINKLVVWAGNAYVLPEEKYAINAIRDVTKWNRQTLKYYENVYQLDELKTLWNRHADHYINNLDDICRNDVNKIRCPTFVLHGDLDPLPEEHVIFLTQNIYDSQLYRFPNGGHNIHQEFAKDFNKIVTEFLLQDNDF